MSSLDWVPGSMDSLRQSLSVYDQSDVASPHNQIASQLLAQCKKYPTKESISLLPHKSDLPTGPPDEASDKQKVATWVSCTLVISIQSRPLFRAPRTLNLTSRVLLPFCHLLLADFQEVIPPPAPTPPSVRLRNIPGPTSSSTPSRRACNTYVPDSRPPLRNPVLCLHLWNLWS
ncbi:uncharacterized protein EI90DRAFT_3121041 [Cantharellus anzutake]|uniref:uncharacterized protein n=1 Tax=Cantharellus anzutake TaxID=1750568 RepID=UPI0019036E72|nr:uncharacterized protein EI90DRAFT_3121041 [Cantharellus anzutake]KAF8334619.1 hypothetical protein EI90DRAFT_3121041 [Cantharellus anzutake]